MRDATGPQARPQRAIDIVCRRIACAARRAAASRAAEHEKLEVAKYLLEDG